MLNAANKNYKVEKFVCFVIFILVMRDKLWWATKTMLVKKAQNVSIESTINIILYDG